MLLPWVTGVHLTLHSCDPDLADSELKSAVSWHHRSGPGWVGILTIMLGSAQMLELQLAKLLSLPLKAWALHSLALGWVLEGQSTQRVTDSHHSVFRANPQTERSVAFDLLVLNVVPVGNSCSLDQCCSYLGEHLCFFRSSHFSFYNSFFWFSMEQVIGIVNTPIRFLLKFVCFAIIDIYVITWTGGEEKTFCEDTCTIDNGLGKKVKSHTPDRTQQIPNICNKKKCMILLNF